MSHHDTENLKRFFEPYELLEVMRDSRYSVIERVQAGQRLAEIGDPRSAVLDVDSMEFCYVPMGRFWMGSDENDEMAYDDERPAGWYDIPYPYWMGRYPVTNAQFNTFVKEGGYQNEQWWGLAKSAGYWSSQGFQGEVDVQRRLCHLDYDTPFNMSNHPVVGVSWFETMAYVEWLNIRWQPKLPSGWVIVLPNEPEREKAARGGEKIPSKPIFTTSYQQFQMSSQRIELIANQNPRRYYPWGDDPMPNLSNYVATEIGTTNAVGCFSDGASSYGCEELSGNVYEWLRNRTDERQNLLFSHQSRAQRGGAYYSDAKFLCCSRRFSSLPFNRLRYYGFRVAVVAVSPP